MCLCFVKQSVAYRFRIADWSSDVCASDLFGSPSFSRGRRTSDHETRPCAACPLRSPEPVEFIYREEPDMQQDGDTYPDSGWRIRGRQGSASDADMEARKSSYVALGAVLNRDDSWLRWIDAPVGTALMRDFDRNIYVAQE